MYTTDKYHTIRMTDQQQEISAAIEKIVSKPKQMVKRFYCVSFCISFAPAHADPLS